MENENEIVALTVEDFPVAEYAFQGMTICGTGLMLCIGALVCIRLLRLT